MEKTISCLVKEQLALVRKTATELQIKRAYHRNYDRKRGSGKNRFYIATGIVSYLTLNKIID